MDLELYIVAELHYITLTLTYAVIAEYIPVTVVIHPVVAIYYTI